ncbi:MAG: P-loop NTPase, partial [Verrucomicrobiota bacterium]|nr:P-loop NTPase [Verrucomicrobiota bacterium]
MIDQTIILPPGGGPNGKDTNYRLTMMVPKKRFLSYLRERWWVVLTCVTLGISAIVTYETIRPETYNSYAQLLVGDMQLNMSNVFTEDSLNYYGTQIELLKSSRLQSAAFTKAGVPATAQEKDLVKLQVVRPMGTSILQLQASGRDPVVVRAFLEALIEEYISFKKGSMASTTEDLLISLNDQLIKREAALKAEQAKWALFQKTNNVAVLEEEGKIAGNYLADLNLQLAKNRLERDLLVAGTGPVNNETNIVEGEIQEVMNTSDTILKSARIDLALRRAEREQLLKERGETAARRLNEEISRLEQTVALLEGQHLMERKAQIQELDQRIAAIQSMIPEWERKVSEINLRLSQGQLLKNNLQNEQAYYDRLVGMFQNVDVGRAVQQERLNVIQTPTQGQPPKRALPLRIAIAGALGFFFSLALVFAWHLMDDRFVSVHDLRDQFGETLLGLVPQIKVPRSKPQEALLKQNDTRQAYADSFRHLRSALMLSFKRESHPQTLLITSAAPGEGKTTISVNLARVLARSGLKVALVDIDGRTAGMQRLLGTEERMGVAEFLRGEADMGAILQPGEIKGLSVIGTGAMLEEEGLFLGPKLQEFMEALRREHQFVILDGAPVLVSDEVALLVPHADAVL